MFQLPDTPVWLLSQGRNKDALNSLCYLRGWTTPENVSEEFNNLVQYAKTIDCCVICLAENKDSKPGEIQCQHHNINFIKR